MIKKQSRNLLRKKRHARVRSKVSGTANCPRLNVFRSNTNIYAQIIAGVTLVSASTMEKALELKSANIAAATTIGKLVAERALEKGITNVVFDRGGYIYHGRIKALAEAAREAGLQF